MFARPQRKKKGGGGSSYTSSVGDNSSLGYSDMDMGNDIEGSQTQTSQHQHLYGENLSVSQLSAGNQVLRVVRRVHSNSSLRPNLNPITHNNPLNNAGPNTYLGTGGTNSYVSRRSISGTYALNSSINLDSKPIAQNSGINKFEPPKFPSNYSHMKANVTPNASFLNPSSAFDELLIIINRKHSTPACLTSSLHELRLHVLRFGLPNEEQQLDLPVSNSIRSKVWKSLLGVYYVSAGEYLQLVAKGPSKIYDKVKNDTFRTLATDKKFLNRVHESKLVRLLNAIVWKTQSLDSEENNGGGSIGGSEYVQGMNVLVAPFLFVMNEVDAFYSALTLLKVYCPTYIQPTLVGVHCGLKLMDYCLEVLDAELFFHLKSKGLSSELYAFASILTLSACTPPLDELLKIWDFLFAFGVHLNVVCTVAQLMLMRQNLLTCPSPVKLLRTFPDLQAAPIIQLTRHLVKQLPANLYQDLVSHPFDPSVADSYLYGNKSNQRYNQSRT